MSVRPRRRLALAAALAVVIVAGTAPAALAVDQSAPVGTITVGDGSGYSRSLTMTVHVPATDDVGVVSMRIGWGDTWQDRPYAPSVEITVPHAEFWGVWVTWRDAAGNESTAGTHVTVDTTPPSVDQIWVQPVGSPLDEAFRVGVRNPREDLTQVTHIRFRTPGAPSWSPNYPVPQAVNPFYIDWPALDPAMGGKRELGVRTVQVSVRNAAGAWSTPKSFTLTVGLEQTTFDISGDQRTGHAVTFTPRVPAGVTYPSGTFCRWTLFWGNDRSLYHGEHDDTFGGIEIAGSLADGHCDPWTVTVPWVPHRQFMVIFLATSGEMDVVQASVGSGPDEPAFEPGVDSTSRHIRSSSLPLVYVLPDTYNLIVGEPATYRAYPIGGAKIKSTDQWSVNYIDHPERKYGGSTFTFTPKITGHLTVCWSSKVTFPRMMHACYDPPARHRDRTVPNTAKPVVRIAPGTGPSRRRVEVSWRGTDKGWGIGSYRLERSTDGGAWARVSLPSATTTRLTQLLATGHTYRYRIRATDKAGNTGTWDTSATWDLRRTRVARTALPR